MCMDILKRPFSSAYVPQPKHGTVLIESFVVSKFRAAVYKLSIVVCYRKAAIDPVIKVRLSVVNPHMEFRDCI